MKKILSVLFILLPIICIAQYQKGLLLKIDTNTYKPQKDWNQIIIHTDNQIYYWTGTYWSKPIPITSTWNTKGNSLLDTSAYIGTPDSVKALQFRLRNFSAGYIGQPSWLDESPYPQNYTFPGSAITALGWKAGQGFIDLDRATPFSSGPSSGFGNTVIGSNAGENVGRKIDPDSSWVRAGSMVMVGSHAGINHQYGNASGYGRNVFVGALAGFMNVAAVGTTIVGGNAGERAMKVTNNTIIGTSSFRTINNGSYNTGVGSSAGYFSTGIIDKVNVTAGGSGYTTATVTISAPKTYAQGNMPYINENTATAVAVISGGVIIGINVTDAGAGYVDTYNITATHGSSAPPTVTITGDGTGATATAVVASAAHNTYIGQASNWKHRGGYGNTAIGSTTGAGEIRIKDSLTNLFGFGARTINGSVPLFNATAIGANTQVGQNHTVILGDSVLNTKVGIGTSFPKAALEINSTTTGILIPRMTTSQKNAIPSPVEGLEVYDLTLHQKSYWNGTIWINY